MPWYHVVKTINGRKYHYRQRTYRAGGRVRTESRYVGAIDESGRAAVLTLMTEDSDEAEIVTIDDRRQSEVPLVASLHIDKLINHRTDISSWALYRESEAVDELMTDQGLTLIDLKPVRVRQGREVASHQTSMGYIVHAPTAGKRTLIKRLFRQVLASRWLDALKDQDPDRYATLCGWLAPHQPWLMSGVRPAWLGLVLDWWQQRRRGHHVASEMAAEMIQRGPKATMARYFKAARKAERELERLERRLVELVQPAARHRQHTRVVKARTRFRKLVARHEQAMWVRIYLFKDHPQYRCGTWP